MKKKFFLAAIMAIVLTSCSNNENEYISSSRAEVPELSGEITTLEDVNQMILSVNQEMGISPVVSRSYHGSTKGLVKSDCKGAKYGFRLGRFLGTNGRLYGTVIGAGVASLVYAYMNCDYVAVTQETVEYDVNSEWRLNNSEAANAPVLSGILRQPVNFSDSVAYYHNVAVEQVYPIMISEGGSLNVTNVINQVKSAIGVSSDYDVTYLTNDEYYRACLAECGLNLSSTINLRENDPEYTQYMQILDSFYEGLNSISGTANINNYTTTILQNINSSALNAQSKSSLNNILKVEVASFMIWLVN